MESKGKWFSCYYFMITIMCSTSSSTTTTAQCYYEPGEAGAASVEKVTTGLYVNTTYFWKKLAT